MLLLLEIISWLMVDLNINSCQASTFRIRLLWLQFLWSLTASHFHCLCMVLRKWRMRMCKLSSFFSLCIYLFLCFFHQDQCPPQSPSHVSPKPHMPPLWWPSVCSLRVKSLLLGLSLSLLNICQYSVIRMHHSLLSHSLSWVLFF